MSRPSRNSATPRGWGAFVLVRGAGNRDIEVDVRQVEAHPRAFRQQKGVGLVRQQFPEVGEFPSQAGLGLQRLPGTPELVLEELARPLAFPARGQQGDEPDRLLARDFHPAPIRPEEAKGPHQPNGVNSGSPRHSNHPEAPECRRQTLFSRLLHIGSPLPIFSPGGSGKYVSMK